MVCEETVHSIDGGGLKFDYFDPNEEYHISTYASAQQIKRDSYYGGNEDTIAYGNTTGLTTVVGGQYMYNFNKLLFIDRKSVV